MLIKPRTTLIYSSPDRLKAGDGIAVIAPSFSMSVIDDVTVTTAHDRIERNLGFKVSYGENANSVGDVLPVAEITDRLKDFHDVFSDDSVNGVLTAIGGYACNQLLDGIDWELVGRNPKIVCGFSDVSVLLNAIFAKTGMMTYCGPHFSTFGQKIFDEYTSRQFLNAVKYYRPYTLDTSLHWTDDLWYLHQDQRTPKHNQGPWVLQEGASSGTSIGGNLCSLNLLQGTEYMPEVDKPILFVEDTGNSNVGLFDRDLQSLLHCVGEVSALLIGRFQEKSDIDKRALLEVVRTKKQLRNIPIVANLDFGHTLPLATLPIGGEVVVSATHNDSIINVTRH